jgi:4-hydroxybenzoate polyprenyltransferase
MKISDFFVFIRWKNLLMIILAQSLIKFVLFQKFDLSTALNQTDFILLVLSSILIASAGYIINDIQDVKTDSINKPEKVFVTKKITIADANNLYVLLNSIGLLIGFYLSYAVDKLSFFAIFIIISLLLYNYAIALKKKLIVSNLIISFVIFLSIVIVPIFDIVPATNAYNAENQYIAFYPVFILACFAFLLTFLREVTKDAEDIEGDKKIQATTFPIRYGTKKTNRFLFILGFLTIVFVCFFAFILWKTKSMASVHLLILVALPLLYFMRKTLIATSKKDYHQLSSLLKIIMLFGLLVQFFL